MKKLITPLLFFLCFVSMFGLTLALPQLSFIPTPWNYLSFLLLVLGLSLVGRTQKRFKAEATEIHTFRAPKKLVTTGLFRFSRNPVILGFFIALLGWAMVLGNAAAFDGALLFLSRHIFGTFPLRKMR